MDGKKKCCTFWIDKDLLNQFDEQFHNKSLFIRECIKKAIKDENFYMEITRKNKGVNNGNKKEVL